MTANQIAAGEVVERPASVVKELVENSLDAAAKHITVDVNDGGTSLIRVRDDGEGISREDASLAFARHATSKIRRASDLNNIITLGFRGEALASIAAVAKVEMITRRVNSLVGTKVNISNGGQPKISEIGCPPGTVISVTDLFNNTPARLKYLKKPSVEARAIAVTIERLALSHPEVAFNFSLDRRPILVTTGNGDLKTVIASVFGLKIGKELLPVTGSGPDWKLIGFVSPPWLHKYNRNQQIIIVNGRYIHNRTIVQTVEKCYQGIIPNGRHPIFLLQVEINPSLVDVNVHPAKLEVRFQQEYQMAQRIAELIKKALVTPKSIASAEISQHKRQNDSKLLFQTNLNFEVREQPEERKEQASNWGDYLLKEGIKNKNYLEENKKTVSNNNSLPVLQVIGQVSNSYILAEGKEGLYIIDQHAAHERCRYESLKKRVKENNWPAQMLQPLVTLHLEPSITLKLIDQIITLREFGFIVENFGKNSFILRSIPIGIPPGKEREILEEFLTKDSYLPASERLLKLVSCHGAIKAGDKMNLVEMQKLLEDLQATEHPYTCPHGRPTITCIDQDMLARYFRRT